MANLPDIGVARKFYPRNIKHMPAVKFFARLDLDQICLFLDGHKLARKLLPLPDGTTASIPGKATVEPAPTHLLCAIC
jgi:hypothetical protein